MDFFRYFDGEIAGSLGMRAATFRSLFEYLESLDHQNTIIVESGCVRVGTGDDDKWNDGQSTVLFDKYITHRKALGKTGTVYSVDANPNAVRVCRELVSSNVVATAADSLSYFPQLAETLASRNERLACVYLDSLDVDFGRPFESALHHLKELCAIKRIIDFETLVVIDDSPVELMTYSNPGQLFIIEPRRIGGKGRYVAEYMNSVGAKQIFSSYQAAWSGVR